MGAYDNTIVDYAQQNNVDPALALAVAQAESGGRQYDANGNLLTSSAGAVGVMQLEPGTAAAYGSDPSNPTENIDAGTAYLGDLINQYGDEGTALAAYNWGPGNLNKAIAAVRHRAGVVWRADRAGVVCARAQRNAELRDGRAAQCIVWRICADAPATADRFAGGGGQRLADFAGVDRGQRFAGGDPAAGFVHFLDADRRGRGLWRPAVHRKQRMILFTASHGTVFRYDPANRGCDMQLSREERRTAAIVRNGAPRRQGLPSRCRQSTCRNSCPRCCRRSPRGRNEDRWPLDYRDRLCGARPL